jgi:hypothetical protein
MLLVVVVPICCAPPRITASRNAATQCGRGLQQTTLSKDATPASSSTPVWKCTKTPAKPTASRSMLSTALTLTVTTDKNSSVGLGVGRLPAADTPRLSSTAAEQY